MKIPMNPNHEQIVIAGMMNNDNAYYDAMGEVDGAHFVDENTGRIFQEQAKAGKRLTANMLMSIIEDPRLKSAARTFDNSWTGYADFQHALKGLKKTHLKRQLYYTIYKAGTNFDETDPEELIATLTSDISSYSFADGGDNMIFPEDRAPLALEEWKERRKNPDAAKGLPYSVANEKGHIAGFPALDKSFNGAHGGDLIMIAAKTGEGKTAFALNLARHFSFRQNFWGYYMNTEMRIQEMEARLLAPIAKVTANEIMHGQLEGTIAEQEAKDYRIERAHLEYMRSKLVMSRIPDLPLHKAKGLANQLKAKMPELQYLIVDYVGRMSVQDFRGNGWEELYEITQQLKELAITLDIPIFILAQRNQMGEVEGAKKMMNECDGVLFFEPTTKEDENDIRQRTNEVSADMINYKIVKKKVRRDDNPYPIYTVFDKKNNFINEVR